MDEQIESLRNMKELIEEERAFLVASDLLAFYHELEDSFYKRCLFWSFSVLKYENYELKLKALKLVPIVELNLNVMKNIRKFQLEFKKKKIQKEVDYQELLLIEMCNWFHTEFFTWVDIPHCSRCGYTDSLHLGLSRRRVRGADRVEKYRCPRCRVKILFPRYNDPEVLLHTRRGRCGEWANCFGLFARALGWDVRLIFDETDHVWVEVYSVIKSKWIHCDPCENAVNTPLMYECGWKKKLSYVMAYSKDDIQDVTWRYSCKHAEVLRNRKQCSEQDLINFIITIRSIMLNRATPARKNFVLKRTVIELVDLMKQNSSSDIEEKGRISGSLVWRLLRGETNEEDFKPLVWRVEPDKTGKKFVLCYVTSKDEYVKNFNMVLQNWKNGLFYVNSVFKKVEIDWKKTYLARKENSDRGLLSWKFETDEEFAIGTINLKLVKRTFGTGMISCRLCSKKTCVIIPEEKETFFTDAFMGSKTVELIVELFGGNGPEAWQHAQILRQRLNSTEATFTIIINLIQVNVVYVGENSIF